MQTANLGVLYIVAIPIGNPEDITIRALKVLQSVDAVLCEEYKQGSKTLKILGITSKELIPVNEHNESEQIPLIVERLLLKKQNLALISDCGTPVFSDPGYRVIKQVSEMNIPVIPIPGASSLMAALSILDSDMSQFVFGGFLPRDPNNRRNELLRLKKMQMPIVLMDTPYRLQPLMDDIQKVFGPKQNVTIACDLTLPGEIIARGWISEVKNQLNKKKVEFILFIHV